MLLHCWTPDQYFIKSPLLRILNGSMCLSLKWLCLILSCSIFMLPLQVQQGVVKVVWSHGNFRCVSFNMVRCRHRYGTDHIHIFPIENMENMLSNPKKRPALCDLTNVEFEHTAANQHVSKVGNNDVSCLMPQLLSADE